MNGTNKLRLCEPEDGTDKARRQWNSVALRQPWARTFRQRNGPMLRRAPTRLGAPHGQTLDAGEQPPPHAALGPGCAYRQAPWVRPHPAPASPPPRPAPCARDLWRRAKIRYYWKRVSMKLPSVVARWRRATVGGLRERAEKRTRTA